ncbi:MAG: phage tail sheath subtilisin-like domain-containing protein [Methylobacter sp.]|uniref:phage tail sheath family protein n=1 Tax=Methylobacter sp. TaxID=2051955 RepID=UPI0025EC0DAD|nr:phage tail sheath C-terminal domain-containing protein [Methylobacter sp.]MCK9621356.1 phage tail sheath subtilisin-like domain-containing protein [Methylobacter sp.]
MPTYQTPGVYYERVDANALGIAAIRTDITGFVGIAQRGPLHIPVPVKSWRQFQSYFGSFTGAGYLSYAVRGFFENGGKRCWVVRIASDIAATATMTLQDFNHQDIWRIEAFSPGVWGNDLEVLVRETHRAQTLTDPGTSVPEYSIVASTTGFVRGTHVRLTQGTKTSWKIVSDVDAGEKNLAGEKRLIWIHKKPEMRRHYWDDKNSKMQGYYDDTPLTGFVANLPILVESVEYTLLVRERGRLIRVYEDLSLVPDHERYGPRVLEKLEVPKEMDIMKTLPIAPEPIVIKEMRDPEEKPLDWLAPLAVTPDLTIPLEGGTDGLALLSIYDFIGEEVSPRDSDVLKQQKQRGLRTLEDIDEVAIVAAPDIHIQPLAIPPKSPLPPCVPDSCLPSGPLPPAIPRKPSVGDLPPVFTEQEIFWVQSALIQQCEKRRDRIALLDPPFAAAHDDVLGVGAVRAWRSRFDSKYAAFYYPWLRVVDPLRSSAALMRDIPPSGHVAGQYAQTDFQFGVHKAPANAPLVWTQDVTVVVGDAVHGILNPAGINVIRPLAGRGIRIFGARTMSSDQDWRFVNVRRLLMMIEKAIYVSTQWAVFEPNNTFTRAKLHLSLTSFLLSLWQKGALMGDVANDAFYVKCDEANNPETERSNGRLLAEVGVAPSQPFEFVIIRVGRTHNEFEITEVTRNISGGMF